MATICVLRLHCRVFFGLSGRAHCFADEIHKLQQSLILKTQLIVAAQQPSRRTWFGTAFMLAIIVALLAFSLLWAPPPVPSIASYLLSALGL